MAEFEFSIRTALKRAWSIFLKHYTYFLVLGLVMVVFNIFSNTHDGFVLGIVVAVASILWSYVGLSSVLAAVDGKEQLLKFDAFKLHLPTLRQFGLYLVLGIATGIFIGAGFILLIIPGIYFLVKLLFANFAFVDRNAGIVQSMKYSWHMIKGDVFWTAFLGLMVTGFIMFLGLILFSVGLLVAYPVALLFLGILYRELTRYQPAAAMVSQPKEISPATPAQ